MTLWLLQGSRLGKKKKKEKNKHRFGMLPAFTTNNNQLQAHKAAVTQDEG